jgi:hypothetical protein
LRPRPSHRKKLMATTLRYLDEILANLPDNTSKLISPENIRDGFASVKVGLGYMYSTTAVTVPIDPDVWVALNPLLVDVTVADELWTFDTNNYATSDYVTLQDAGNNEKFRLFRGAQNGYKKALYGNRFHHGDLFSFLCE